MAERTPDPRGESPRKEKPVSRPRSASTALWFELREHIPFSVSAVAMGMIVAGTICILAAQAWQPGTDGLGVPAAVPGTPSHSADHSPPVERAKNHQSAPAETTHDRPTFALLFFHLFHPAHMLFSAAATAAMFFRYERKTGKAIVVGLIGAIGICGVSDIAMPQASLVLLGVHTPWHICVVEHPSLVLPFALVGVLIGIGTADAANRATIVSHSLHVWASTMASIFYMIGPLGTLAWIHDLGQVFIFVVLAVMIPCCLSDIVFPLLMTQANRQRYFQEPHAH